MSEFNKITNLMELRDLAIKLALASEKSENKEVNELANKIINFDFNKD